MSEIIHLIVNGDQTRYLCAKAYIPSMYPDRPTKNEDQVTCKNCIVEIVKNL